MGWRSARGNGCTRRREDKEEERKDRDDEEDQCKDLNAHHCIHSMSRGSVWACART